MAAHILVILQQGIWASATGGWFFDAHQNIFSNTFHLYIWLILLCLPLTLYLTLSFTPLIWGIYCITIVVLFSAIKFINHRLHIMYDTGMAIVESESEGVEQSDKYDQLESNPLQLSDPGMCVSDADRHGEPAEAIEMTTIVPSTSRWPRAVSMTPPVLCSSRASESSGSGRRVMLTPADSMEYIRKMIKEDVSYEKSKLCGSEGFLVRRTVKTTKESLNHPVNDSSDATALSTDTKLSLPPSTYGAAGASHAPVDSATSGSSLLRPTLSSPARKGHGHRHRRAVRRASGSADYAGLSPTDIDPREPQVVVIRTDRPAFPRTLPSGRPRSAAAQTDESVIALKTFSTDCIVGSPVHSDLSSLSSYKETSPESESAAAHSAIPRWLESRRLSKGRPSALSQTRDSLETYKDRSSRRKLSGESGTNVMSESAIVHREPSGSGADDGSRTDLSNVPIAPHYGSAIALQSIAPDAPQHSIDDKTDADADSKQKLLALGAESSENASSAAVEQSGNNSESSHTLTAANSDAAGDEKDKSSSVHQLRVVDSIDNKESKSRTQQSKRALARLLDGSVVEVASLAFGVTAAPSGITDALENVAVPSEWLYTDSDDSQTSGDVHFRSEATDSSSTITNDELHATPTLHHHRKLADLDLGRSTNRSSNAKVSKSKPDSAGKRPQSQKRLLQCATCSNPIVAETSINVAVERLPKAADSTEHIPDDESEELKLHRSRGAIPKRRPPPDLPSSSHSESGGHHRPAGRQLSLERLEVRHRMLLMLRKSIQSEVEEELRKQIELSVRGNCLVASERNSPRRWPSDRPATPGTRREAHCRSKSEDGRDGRSKGRSHGRKRQSATAESSGAVACAGDQKMAESSHESSISNHELLALLPEHSELEAGASADAGAWWRTRHNGRSSWCSSMHSDQPPKSVIESVSESIPNRHVARSHDDTSEGAIHCFKDEFGNWLTYTFGENGVLMASGMTPAPDKPDKLNAGDSSSEESTFHDIDVLGHRRPTLHLPIASMTGDGASASCCHDDTSPSTTPSTNSSNETITNETSVAAKRPKHYYWFQLLPSKRIKVQLDRLDLLAMLDRNTIPETILSILLAVSVCILGSVLLAHGFFHDFAVFWLCFVIAGCQYSLLKSVQPDAASPMHGYNRMIVFSRPSYFCLCASLILSLHYGSVSWHGVAFRLYGVPFTVQGSLVFARDLVIVFLLCLPAVFTFGLLPQVNTFLMYLLEQIEIHIFGGTATTSLTAAVASVGRSCVAVMLLYGLCYTGIKDSFGTLTSPNTSQHVLFSVFCGVLVPVCYHLSRLTSDPSVTWQLVKRTVLPRLRQQEQQSDDGERKDPLPEKLCTSVSERLKSDLIVCIASGVFVFAVSVSTAFSSPVLQPLLFDVLVYLSTALGLTIHYLIPHLRKEMPWMCCSHPLLVSHERGQFEVKTRVMVFEKLYVWLRFFECNFMLPTVFLCALTQSTRQIVVDKKFEIFIAAFIIVVCSIKMFRGAFTNPSHQFYIILFTMFFFRYDFADYSESFLIDYFFLSILLNKVYELMLKLRFILTYIAPWQITWGSAFHAFAQPFSVPHSAMLFVQAVVSTVLSAPLNPLLGSAIFITSYMRPLRFWEKDYNTKRVDHTNTRLSSQLEYNPGADDNNLNSIFYEHLTRSLQHSLCGDLLLGRWGSVLQGDCFIIASDYLNALVHIIEMGNGFVTFQLRGLEFRGTYCQQREVEAITEDVEGDEGFCCCKPGHLPHFLSLNAAFSERWLAWEVVVTRYIIEGYSISDNSAAPMLQVYDLRKVLITYYVKSIIYYTVRSLKLDQWLENENIREGLQPTLEKHYVDLDPTFAASVDEDYDHRLSGVSKSSFVNVYLDWLQYCAARRDKTIDAGKDSWLVALCFALSLLGRRALGTASHNNSSANVEFFLCGLHALFKGDLRITSPRDEWVFSDMELLRRVVAPGIRMSLKLHQDHFTSPDEYDDHQALYDAISSHELNMVISHEADPAWRNAVLSNVPSLLALRHVFDDGSDEYKVIMLNKRYLSFRVIKVNRECVRGLWAGQLQELIYLRNRNPERGSIQNAKQALRNMINSSCDQPIGYPIYVSPLTTSYSGTNEQYTRVIGRESSYNAVFDVFRRLWHRMRTRCGSSCTGSSSMVPDGDAFGCRSSGATGPPVTSPPVLFRSPFGAASEGSVTFGLQSLSTNRSSLSCTNTSAVVGLGTSPAAKSVGRLSSLSGLVSVESSRDITQRVQITDASLVYDSINLLRRGEVNWPNEEWRSAGGRTGWNGWSPNTGDIGVLVHQWLPCHRDPSRRSHVDKTICLVQIGDKYVPVDETGVTVLSVEV